MNKIITIIVVFIILLSLVTVLFLPYSVLIEDSEYKKLKFFVGVKTNEFIFSVLIEDNPRLRVFLTESSELISFDYDKDQADILIKQEFNKSHMYFNHVHQRTESIGWKLEYATSFERTYSFPTEHSLNQVTLYYLQKNNLVNIKLVSIE